MGSEPQRTSLVDLFLKACDAGGDGPALRQLDPNRGEIREVSWREWRLQSENFAAGWLKSGLLPGDRVVLSLRPSPEWKIVELSILMAGGIPVPVGPRAPASRLWRIVHASGARFLVCSWPDGVFSFLAPEGGPPEAEALDKVFYEKDPGNENDEPDAGRAIEPAWKERLFRLSELAESGRSHLELNPGCVERAASTLGADTPFTVLYTAGTSGRPKGVILDHGNILFKCRAVSERLDLGSGAIQLLVLPLDSIFGLVASWAAVHQQVPTAISRGPQHMGEELKKFRPAFLAGVPEIYQFLANLIVGSNGEVSEPVRRLCTWARQTLERASTGPRRRKSLRARLPAEVASGVLSRRLRKLTGGRVKHLVSGGAALPEELAHLFAEAGIPILHGYGLTETSGLTHLNPASDPRPDTVGQPLPGIEVKLAPDGEILVRGRCVFVGYWNDAEATEAVMREGEWFSTGDLGIVEDGYLRVTGRKHDVLSTLSGRRLAPLAIEGALTSRPEIRRALVVGDQRPFVSALVEPDTDVLWRMCGRRGVTPEDWDAGSDVETAELLRRAVSAVNGALSPYERIRDFRVVSEGFSEQRGEVGASGQPRRHVVLERYAALVEQMYVENAEPTGKQQ